MKGFGFWLTLALTGASCAASPPGERSAGAPADGVAGIAPGIVGGAAARKLAAAGVKIVDVRTRDEFVAGHVPGAVNVPFQEVARRHAEIGPPTTPVLLYCESGRRSGIAARILRDKGFTRIFDLQSYDRWVRSEPATEPPK